MANLELIQIHFYVLMAPIGTKALAGKKKRIKLKDKNQKLKSH